MFGSWDMWVDRHTNKHTCSALYCATLLWVWSNRDVDMIFTTLHDLITLTTYIGLVSIKHGSDVSHLSVCPVGYSKWLTRGSTNAASAHICMHFSLSADILAVACLLSVAIETWKSNYPWMFVYGKMLLCWFFVWSCKNAMPLHS